MLIEYKRLSIKRKSYLQKKNRKQIFRKWQLLFVLLLFISFGIIMFFSIWNFIETYRLKRPPPLNQCNNTTESMIFATKIFYIVIYFSI
jgi:uncharacterized BrkB/YihY/UPF0761 family membrane protein